MIAATGLHCQNQTEDKTHQEQAKDMQLGETDDHFAVCVEYTNKKTT